MFKSFTLIVVLLCAIIGCPEKAPTTKQESAGSAPGITGTPAEMVQKTIRRYNHLLADGYKNLNMTKLQEVATEDQALKAYYHAAALTEGKSRMLSEMKKIDFVKLDFTQSTKCRVITKETWDFAYADIQSGKKTQDVKDYEYHVSYVLENLKGTWMITEIAATGEERKEMPTWKTIFEAAPPKTAK